MAHSSSKHWQALGDWRFLISLIVLIFNDHWLKYSYGSWFTGKLSDFVGLVVLPVVLCVIAGFLSLGRYRSLIFGFVGVWFFGLKTLQPVASFTEQLASSVTGSGSQILVDPTDLVGLVMLPVAWRVLSNPQSVVTLKSVKLFVLGVASLASVATSQEQEPDRLDLVLDEGTGEVSVLDVSWNQRDFDADPSNLKKVCSPAAPETCYRITDHTVEQSSGDGWEVVWQIDASSPVTRSIVGSHDYSGLSLTMREIAADSDGKIYVTVDGLETVLIRDGQGTWTPSAQSLRYSPILILSLVISTGYSLFIALGRRFVLLGLVSTFLGFLASLGFLTSEDLFIPFISLGVLIVAFLMATIVFSNAWIDLTSRYGFKLVAAIVLLAFAGSFALCVPLLVWMKNIEQTFESVWPTTFTLWFVMVVACLLLRRKLWPGEEGYLRKWMQWS